MNTEIIDKVTNMIYKKASRLMVDDISVVSAYGKESMLRFSNNSITVVDTLDEVAVLLYLAKDRKRVVGTTSSLREEDLDRFVTQLFSSMVYIEESEEYTPLPKGPFKYKSYNSYDISIERLGEELTDYCNNAINAALKEGAVRVSGVLTSDLVAYKIKTSCGVESMDKSSSITINVRAFSETSSSGHGLSCAASLPKFDPGEAGATAGRFAKESKRTGYWEEGMYDLIVGPTVAADLMQMVALSASAFRVDTGTSFLKDCLGKKVASEQLILQDYGTIDGGFDGRAFDDEGVPTKQTNIIENGVLLTYLHNTSTAKKYNTVTTANAGIISPHPWNIVVNEGDMSLGEMISESKKAVYVTNNWYTRYQNYVTGEYSTLPRDATFVIDSGSIKYAITGTRISDNIPRQLLNISGIGKRRKWVKWWEVETPVYTPPILIKNVKITKAQF
ncbi:MAG: TldD/PmbA family protein [Nitrososphaeria archaeon]